MEKVKPVSVEAENAGMTDNEKIDQAAQEILERFREAFEELAK